MSGSETVRESLSALLDGEASELDIARAVKSLDDTETRAYWVRQNTIRMAMTSGSAHLGIRSIDISGRVAAEIAGTAPTARQWGKNPLVGLAVAASVTVAVVFGGQAYLAGEVAAPVNGLPGGVVALQGGVPVQASFGASAQPSGQKPIKTVDATLSREYERLALRQLERYGATHARIAAKVQPTQIVPHIRLSEHDAQ